MPVLLLNQPILIENGTALFYKMSSLVTQSDFVGFSLVFQKLKRTVIDQTLPPREGGGKVGTRGGGRVGTPHNG